MVAVNDDILAIAFHFARLDADGVGPVGDGHDVFAALVARGDEDGFIFGRAVVEGHDGAAEAAEAEGDGKESFFFGAAEPEVVEAHVEVQWAGDAGAGAGEGLGRL